MAAAVKLLQASAVAVAEGVVAAEVVVVVVVRVPAVTTLSGFR